MFILTFFIGAVQRAKPAPTVKRKIIILTGAAGTGKSVWCKANMVNPYRKSPNNKWFCGFQPGTTDLLLEEMAPGHGIPLDLLKELTDPNNTGFFVEIKGLPAVWIAPLRVVITSNFHPCHWFAERDFDDGLRRRLQKTHEKFEYTIHHHLMGGETIWEMNPLLVWQQDQPVFGAPVPVFVPETPPTSPVLAVAPTSALPAAALLPPITPPLTPTRPYLPFSLDEIPHDWQSDPISELSIGTNSPTSPICLD